MLEDKELNVIDHLDELRKRLIIIVVSFILFLIIGFIYVEDIYKWFVKDLKVTLIVLGPSDILWIYFHACHGYCSGSNDSNFRLTTLVICEACFEAK